MRHNVILTVLSIVLFIGSGILGFYAYTIEQDRINKQSIVSAGGKSSSSSSSNSRSESKSSSSQIEEVDPEYLRLNTLFFGNAFFGRRIHKWAQASTLKYKYPFSGLSTFEKNKYDAWIAGLECPVTPRELTDYQQETILKFNCKPEYIPEAAKWFEAFTLANNHIDNMEEFDGLNQTRKYLTQNGIQYFGHFDNAKTDDICEILSFKTTPNYGDQKPTEKKTYQIPVAMCGFHNVFKLPTQDQLQVIKKYSQLFPTIVTPHQGAEYRTTADSLQRQYYRNMIDLGADAVIGDHPHTTQNTEAYKGKLIVYSLGNFIFDQQSNANVTQSIGANLNFHFEYDDNLKKWTELATTCKKFKDDCLENAKEQKLSKPKFTIAYDYVATDNSNRLTKKASPAVQQAMRIRTNWDQTLRGLNKRN